MDNNAANRAPSILLSDYAANIAETDVIDPADINPILQGIYGEVGGIMSTAKKHIREKSAYPGFQQAAEEEFGDTLWYLAALCRRLDIALDEVVAEAASGERFKLVGAASDLVDGAFAHVALPISSNSVDETLFSLGRSAAALLVEKPSRALVAAFARDYLDALHDIY